jgi:YD repeat-containing protein
MRRFALILLLGSLLFGQDVVQLEKKIYFDKNSARLSKEAKNYLDRLAPYLKRQRDLKKSTFTISGHTDMSGTELKNKSLSKTRACNVKEYLVKKHHIKAARLECVGYGANRPIADNSLEAGRRLNRYAVIGRKKEFSERDFSVKYKYDKLGRLIRADYANGHAVRFEYDAMGNILKRTDTNR